MKQFGFEIDMARGFDVCSAETGKVVAHFDDYDEAVAMNAQHESWYVRYYVKRDEVQAA